MDLFERVQTPEGKAALAGKNLPGTMRKVMATYRRLLGDEWAAARGAEAVVYHVAEAVGVPGFLAHPVPMFSPTRAFPNPVLTFANLGGYLNRASYGAFLRLLAAPFRRAINSWRKESLGLPPRRFLASSSYAASRYAGSSAAARASSRPPPTGETPPPLRGTGSWTGGKNGVRRMDWPGSSRAGRRPCTSASEASRDGRRRSSSPPRRRPGAKRGNAACW